MSRKKSDHLIGDIIQFHKTDISIDETLVHVSRALRYARISGDGPYTQKCTEILEAMFGWGLLVHLGKAALEMAALLVRNGLLTLREVPEYVRHNGHIFLMLCDSERVV